MDVTDDGCGVSRGRKFAFDHRRMTPRCGKRDAGDEPARADPRDAHGSPAREQTNGPRRERKHGEPVLFGKDSAKKAEWVKKAEGARRTLSFTQTSCLSSLPARRQGNEERARSQKTMRIIVTGSRFIGSHIVDGFWRLADTSSLSTICGTTVAGAARTSTRASFVHLDIRDEGLVRVFRGLKPEVVCHHAAQHSVSIGSRDPRFDAAVNVSGLLNVLEASVASGARKVLFASSAATYGEIAKLPADETTPQKPVSPYGITKMVAEHYLRFFKSEHGLDYTAFATVNMYGPRQDPNGEAGVIAIFAGKFLAGEPVRIDWDGEQTRDYVYVADVVRANLIGLDKGSGECYVIGTGVRDLGESDLQSARRSDRGQTDRRARAAPRRRHACRVLPHHKAERELGWRPEPICGPGCATVASLARIPANRRGALLSRLRSSASAASD